MANYQIETREAGKKSICPFSGEVIMPGDRITKYSFHQHNAFINEINMIPYDVADYIMRMSGEMMVGHWGLDKHTNWLSRKTSSGRVVKKVLRQENRDFVAGSGFVGCDHYDPSYNDGEGCEEVVQDKRDLKEFIVDDDFVEYDLSLQPDAESEEEYDDEDYSDEEDDSFDEEDLYDSDEE